MWLVLSSASSSRTALSNSSTVSFARIWSRRDSTSSAHFFLSNDGAKSLLEVRSATLSNTSVRSLSPIGIMVGTLSVSRHRRQQQTGPKKSAACLAFVSDNRASPDARLMLHPLLAPNEYKTAS